MLYTLELPLVRYVVEWMPDSSEIVFSEYRLPSWFPYVSMQAVDRNGTKLRELHTPDGGPYVIGVHADLSPDGGTLALASCEREDRFSEIRTVKIDGTASERLTANGYDDYFPMWSPSGDAIAFLTAPYGTVAEGYWEVRLLRGDGGGGEGTVVIRHDDLHQRATHYTPYFTAYPPQWSPDGTRLAVLVTETADQRWALFGETYRELEAEYEGFWGRDVFSRSWGIYIVQPGVLGGFSGAYSSRLSGALGGVSWSPDGEQLALIKVVGSDVALVTVARDGTDQQVVTRLTEQEVNDSYWAKNAPDPLLAPVSWSPNGSNILFRCGVRLCVVGLDGERVDAWPLEHLNPHSQPQAAWSPDGSRLAVVGEFESGPISSDPTFRTVLFTMAVDGTDVRVLVGRVGDGKLEPLGARPVEAGPERACAVGVKMNQYASVGGARDCETLLRMRDTLAGNPRLNWGAGHYLSAWEGVTVRGLVEKLELPDRRLSGTIPAELSDLAHLTRLSLPRNTLQGSIPAELGQLTNLTHLDLSDNQLTGSIPPELSQLVSLEELYLGGNALTGCIPAALLRVPENDLDSLGLPACQQG